MAYHPELKCSPLVEKSLSSSGSSSSGFTTMTSTSQRSYPILSPRLFCFFREFPLPYHEEHIHLTGSLSAEFIYPRLKKLLEGPDKKTYEEKSSRSMENRPFPSPPYPNVRRLPDPSQGGEQFKTYLKILYLSKLILTTKEAHDAAAFHIAF
ncbi:MAG: hypothetical protein QM760_14975 [Nibricoccus sp.]